jgi:hypothetical protein
VIDGDPGVEEQGELHRRPVARRRKKDRVHGDERHRHAPERASRRTSPRRSQILATPKIRIGMNDDV